MQRRMSAFIAFVAALALFLPVGALAKDNDKTEHQVKLDEPVMVGTTQLKPGNYKVEWQGTGNAVPITFMQDGKTVLSTTGSVIEKNNAAETDEVMTRKAGNQQKLEELDFGHRKEALVFTPASSGM